MYIWYVCMYKYLFTCTHKYLHIFMYMYIHVCVYIFTNTYSSTMDYVPIYIHIYIYLKINAYTYANSYANMHQILYVYSFLRALAHGMRGVDVFTSQVFTSYPDTTCIHTHIHPHNFAVIDQEWRSRVESSASGAASVDFIGVVLCFFLYLNLNCWCALIITRETALKRPLLQPLGSAILARSRTPWYSVAMRSHNSWHNPGTS